MNIMLYFCNYITLNLTDLKDGGVSRLGSSLTLHMNKMLVTISGGMTRDHITPRPPGTPPGSYLTMDRIPNPPPSSSTSLF